VEFERIYRDLVMREFWWEARLGLQVAFYRTYAVPGIARLLMSTGELTGRPLKRGYDTGIIMYELIYHGFDHPRGKAMVSLLNRTHRAHGIPDDQYRYVLGALMFVPTRIIDRFGRRRLSDVERAATFAFYRRLGELMHIGGLPETAEEFESFFDGYEMGFSEAGAQLFQSSKTLVVQRTPRPLRGVAAAVNYVLLDEPVRRALGLPRPGRPTALAARILLWLGSRTRRRGKDAWFPGRANPVYPGGYTLDEIGPPA
jgi:hypothetical protein